jgi:hypothetical protein
MARSPKPLDGMDIGSLEALKRKGFTYRRIAREARVPYEAVMEGAKGRPIERGDRWRIRSFLDQVFAMATANPVARENFFFGKKKVVAPAAPAAPQLGYKEAIAIAEALKQGVKADYYLIKAPSLMREQPVWYFLQYVTHREFDRAKASGVPQTLIKSSNPWPTTRWNLGQHRSPERLTLAVLNTYDGTFEGPYSYLDVAGKAGNSNPKKKGQKRKKRLAAKKKAEAGKKKSFRRTGPARGFEMSPSYGGPGRIGYLDQREE